MFHSQGKYQEALTDYQTALRIRPDMRWQIEPYMQDVQEKFVEKAAAAEAVRFKRQGPATFQFLLQTCADVHMACTWSYA